MALMLRLRTIVLALLPATACPLFACESDSGTGAVLAPDAGASFDGAPPSPDSGAPPASSTVTVTVLGEDGPRAGVLVVFHDASGAVLETRSTGADGKAASAGATPAMASALLERSTARNIVTWTAIEAGDELTVNDFEFFTQRGTYDVSLTAPFDGAVRYNARVAHCETFGNAWDGVEARNLPVNASCVRAQNAILVDALSADDVLAHAFAKNVAAPGAAALAVTVGGFVAPTDVVLSRTNVPAGMLSSAELKEIVGGGGYSSFGVGDGEGEGDGSQTFRAATGFADAMQGAAYARSAGGQALVLSRRVSVPPPADSFAFDFAGALPSITDATTGMTDPRRPDIAWTSAAPLTSADGGFVRFMLYLGGDSQLTWTMVVPPGATSVKGPALPAEADAWLPAGDVGAAYLHVIFAESDLIPDYRAFRRQQGTMFRSDAFDSIPTLPTNGTLKISRWSNDG